VNFDDIIFLTVLLLLTVCCATTEAQFRNAGVTNYIYAPHLGNFDNLSDKGDISLQIASGALTNIDFPSARLAFCPLNNFAIGINYFSFASSFNSIQAQSSSAWIASAELSYRDKFLKHDLSTLFRWQVDFGYGAGKLIKYYGVRDEGDVNLGIQRYILAGSAIYEIKEFGLGLGLRGSYFNYTESGAFGEVPQDEIDRINYLLSVSPALLLDLSTRIEFGGDVAKLFFNLDWTIYSFKDDNDLLNDFINRESVHLGFYVLINKAFNKIKLKRNEKN